MKKRLFKIHSLSALIAMLPLVLMSITGSILVFKAEIDQWLMPEQVTLQPSAITSSAITSSTTTDLTRLSLDDLAAQINQSYPEYEIGTWEFFYDQKQADAAYLIQRGTFDWYKLYLDPYQGKILSTPVPLEHDFTDWLVALHYTFLLGDIGTLLGSVMGLLFLAIGITGIILYRRFWQHLFYFRLQRGLAILLTDSHKFIGITASPILLILGITGTYWNIAEFIHEVYGHTPEQENFVLLERRYNETISLQTLYEQSQHQLHEFTPTYLVLAYEPDKAISFYGTTNKANIFASDYASGISFDPQTGKLTQQWDIRELPTFLQVIDSFRHLHFGTLGGMATKILWCIVGIMPLFLAMSGAYLWAFRQNKRQRSRINRQQLLAK